MARDEVRRNYRGDNYALASELVAGSASDHIEPLTEDSRLEADSITAWPQGASVMGVSDTANWDGSFAVGTVFTSRTGIDEGFQLLAQGWGNERLEFRIFDSTTPAWSPWVSVRPPLADTANRGTSKLSVNAAVPSNPIAVGDNDPRMSNARTPTSHGSSHGWGAADPARPSVRAVQTIGAAGAIAVGSDNIILVTATADRTGITMAAGAFDGQFVSIVNRSAFTLTLDPVAATSRVAGGSGGLAPNSRGFLVWDADYGGAGVGRWVRQASDGAAALPTLRSLGTGATQAAAGNHGHATLDLPEQASPASPATDTGRLYTLDVNGKTEPEYRDSSGVIGRPFLDTYFVAQNTTGSTIAKGSAVRVSGQSASRVPLVALADADALATMPAGGITMESITNNSYGRVMVQGVLTGLATTGLTAGAPLYASGTAGALTQTAPLYPAFRQVLGSVMSVHATTGEIFVNVAHFFRQVGTPIPVALFDGGTTLATSTVGAVGRWLATTNLTGTLTEVRGILATASSSGSVTAVVSKNGTSIGTLTFTASSTTSNTLTPATAIAAGDYITCHVTAAGTGASLLTVMGELMTAA